MITNYQIKKINDEEVLYLYINYNYEFASEFNNKENNNNLKKQITNYVNNLKDTFNGKKIVLIISGVLMCTLLLVKKEEINSNIASYNDNTIFNIVEKNEEKYDIKLEEIKEIETISEIESPIQEEIIIPKKIEQSSPQETVENKKTSTNVTQNNNNQTIQKENEEVKQENIEVKINTELPNKETPIVDEIKENVQMVTINRQNGSVLTLPLEEYLIGVVSAEMPASFNIEALKAQSIVARTYALKRISENKPLTDTSETQNYKDENQMKSYWGSEYQKYHNKIVVAVNQTKGMYITYNNQYIDAVYFATSNGKTEDAVNVWNFNIPYLKSVDSSFDSTTTPYSRVITKPLIDIETLLGYSLTNQTEIIYNRNNNNYIDTISIDNHIYDGIYIQKLFGLRSDDYDIEILDNSVNFTTRGYGHGVGMSQYGANYLANHGNNYEQIIKYYYQNIEIKQN